MSARDGYTLVCTCVRDMCSRTQAGTVKSPELTLVNVFFFFRSSSPFPLFPPPSHFLMHSSTQPENGNKTSVEFPQVMLVCNSAANFQ